MIGRMQTTGIFPIVGHNSPCGTKYDLQKKERTLLPQAAIASVVPGLSAAHFPAQAWNGCVNYAAARTGLLRKRRYYRGGVGGESNVLSTDLGGELRGFR